MVKDQARSNARNGGNTGCDSTATFSGVDVVISNTVGRDLVCNFVGDCGAFGILGSLVLGGGVCGDESAKFIKCVVV